MKSINKLQQKWGVGQVQFWLIMTTFALGGSLSGYLNKQILNLVFLEKNAAYWLIYPLLLTILWPFSVILVSFLTGQFSFFKGYLGRMWGRLSGGNSNNGSANGSAAPASPMKAPGNANKRLLCCALKLNCRLNCCHARKIAWKLVSRTQKCRNRSAFAIYVGLRSGCSDDAE